MTKDKTVTMSRELVQRWVDNTDFFEDLRGKSMTEINEAKKEDEKITEELRAILAAPVVERQPEPLYPRCTILNECNVGASGSTQCNTSPPAPVAVPVEIHQQLIEMRQQYERANFVSLGKLLNACLDKVKGLNQ